jgi:hypothetical protein
MLVSISKGNRSVGSGLHLAFLHYWINLYGVGLNPISANHYKGLAGAGRFA